MSSTTIDERVVEMRFDNKHFESNVSTTMSTLDKLKQKLNLSGASKGLEGLNTAARKVDLSSIGNSAEKVGLKFDAMYTIADQALRNITNSAMAAGKRIVSALTIDPVKTGFQEYETQINAVQTILANTQSKGTTIDDVNVALEELNKYADKTIYNFTEMTRNIGTFTAAGVDLETSVNAIQGIANLAAVSGSTSQQASTAMYQLSQALSSGTVKLMDWNSVVNAGMGGQVFQDALKETARVHGIAIDQMIEEQGSFRETLSEGWLTSEILTETLQKFTLTTEGLTDAQIEANREMLRAKGYTETQIDEIFKLGATATDAATKVKTFTQLWDVLKEAAQSGWSQTWKIIVGDFEEAKALLTPLADMLTGFINKMSDWRNTLVQGVFGDASPFQRIKDIFENSGLGKITEYAKKVTDLSDKLEYYQDVVNRVWRGDYNNRGDNPDRYDLLSADGYDYRVVQELVNKGYQYKLTVEDIQAAYEKYGLTAEEAAEATEKVAVNIEDLSDEQLRNMGLTDAEIKLLRQLEQQAKDSNKSLSELLDERSKLTGRQMLIDSFKSIGKVLGDIAKVIGEAWQAIFNPEGISAEDKMNDRIVGLYGMLNAFYDFATGLEVTEETADKISRTFKGLFAVLDLVTSIFGGGFKLVFNILSEVLSYFHLDILDVTAAVGDALVAFHDWLFSLVDIHGILDVVVPWIGKAVDWFKELFKTVKESEAFKTFCGYLSSAYEAVKNWITSINVSDILSKFVSWVQKAAEWCKGLIDSVRDSKAFGVFVSYLSSAYNAVKDWITGVKSLSIRDIFNGIVESIKNFGSSIYNSIRSIPGMGEWIDKFVGGISGIGGSIMDWFGGIKDTENIPLYIIQGLVKGLKDGVRFVWESATSLAKTLVDAIKEFLGIHSPSTVFIAIGGFIIAGLVYGLKNGFGTLWDTLSGLVTSIVDNVTGFIQNVDLGGLLAGGILAGFAYAGVKFATAISNFSKPFAEVGDFLDGIKDAAQRMSKGVTNYLNSQALLNLAKAIGILALALIALTFVDAGKLWSAVGAVAAVGAVLAGLMVVLDKFGADGDKISEKFKTMAIVAGLAASLLLVAAAFKMVAGLDEDGLIKAGVFVVGMAALVVGFVAISKLAANRDMTDVAKLVLAISAAMLLMAHVAKTAGSMEWEQLGKAGAMIGAFAIVTAGLIWATKLAGDKDVTSASKLIMAVGVAMLLMAHVAKSAGSMEWEELGKGAAMVAAFAGIVVGLIAATKLAGGKKHVDSAAKLVMAVGVAMLLMVFTAKIASSMEVDELIKGGLVVAAFGGIVVGLIAATKLAGGKKLQGVASTIMAASLAIGAMALVAVILGFIDTNRLTQGLVAVGYLALLIGGLMVVSAQAKDCKGTLIGITAAIVALAASVVVLSLIDPSKLGAATVAMSIVLGMLALVLKASSNVQTSIGVLVTLTVMIGLLAGMLFVLGKFTNGDSVLKSALGLSSILVVLSGVLIVLSKLGPKAKNAKSGIGALALLSLVVGELAVILGLMAYLKVEASMNNVKALSVMISVLSGVLVVVSLLGTKAKDVGPGVKALMMLGVVVAELGLVLGLMSAFNVEASMNNVKALSVMIGVLTGVVAVLSLLGSKASGVMPAVGAMAVLALVVGELAIILGLMSALNVEASMPNVLGLSALMIVLTGVLTVLSILGPLASGAMAGVGAMAVLALVVGELAIILGLMSALDIEPSLGQIAGLSTLLITMTGVLTVLTIIGPLATLAYPAMAALAVLIAGLVGVIAALGGLSKIPGFNELIADGGKVLGSIGQAIGAFVGGLVAGFAMEMLEVLPAIGTALSMFMVNATPFIVGIKMVDEQVLAGVGILSAAVIALTAADLIAGISSFIQGGSSFATLGTELSAFMVNAMPFIMGASLINEDMVAGVKGLAETILILTAADVLEGLTSWLTGGSSLASFGEQLPILATGLASFKTALGENGFTENDAKSVQYAADAVKSLATAASEIPNSGGWVGAILGENDLDTFAEKFPVLAQGLVGFKNAMSEAEFTEDDLTLVDVAANAVKTLATAANEIPNSGGWVGAIIGENDLDTFAEKFPKLAEGLVAFKTAIASGDVTFTEDDLTAVDAAANAVKKFSEAAQNIPNSDGWVAKIIGDNDLSTFASKFPDVATGLAGFKTNIGTWTEEDSTMITYCVSAISALADVAKKINEDTTIWDALNDDFMTFIGKLPEIGTNLKSFGTNLGSGFSLDTAEVLKIAASSLSTFASITVPEDGGAALVTLASNLSGISTNLKTFGTNMKGVKSEDMQHASNIVSKLKTIISNINAMSTDTAFSKTNACRNISVMIGQISENFRTMDPQSIENPVRFIDELTTMIEGLATIDTSGVSALENAVKSLVDDSITAFADGFSSVNAGQAADDGIRAFISKAATAVGDNSETLSSAFGDLVDAAISAIGTESQYQSFYDAGSYLVDGFAAGISQNDYKADAKAAAMAKSAKIAAEKALGIKSPSRVFYAIGDYAGQGFVNALSDYADTSYDASSEMANSARSGLSDAISKIRRMLTSDLDVQPTIRPVMDLSDVKSGIGSMNDLLSIGSSSRILATVGSINSAMNRRSQNGVNGDVVSAIDKLRGDMANNRGDTYNINGVTYDDGSNISEAVRVIVREAKIQRRR